MNTDSHAKQATSKPARDAKGRLLPGHTANPHGRPPAAFSATDIIRARVAERPRVIDQLFAAADAGEAWAIQYIIDRIEGRPKQSVDQTVHTDPPAVEAVRELQTQLEGAAKLRRVK